MLEPVKVDRLERTAAIIAKAVHIHLAIVLAEIGIKLYARCGERKVPTGIFRLFPCDQVIQIKRIASTDAINGEMDTKKARDVGVHPNGYAMTRQSADVHIHPVLILQSNLLVIARSRHIGRIIGVKKPIKPAIGCHDLPQSLRINPCGIVDARLAMPQCGLAGSGIMNRVERCLMLAHGGRWHESIGRHALCLRHEKRQQHEKYYGKKPRHFTSLLRVGSESAGAAAGVFFIVLLDLCLLLNIPRQVSKSCL